MEKIVYLNGKYMQESEAKVSIFDRGFLFADGIYEVVPVVNHKVLDKKPFFERLKYSLSQVQIEVTLTESEILTMIETLIEKNSIKEGAVYMQITRGVSPRNFSFPKDITSTFMAFAFEKNILNNPQAIDGVKVASVEDIRWKRRDIKSIALLAQCIAKEEAVQKDAFEGWMIEDGYVTEGTTSSAFIVKDEVIITRPLSNEILPGIRRKILLEIVEKYKFKLQERTFTIEEALDADEAFMSSATTFVLPIIEIDGKKIGTGKPGNIYKKLRELYVQSSLKEAGVSL
ncbi:D-alanine aminotransferase [hydrothermal vent metagenome]|uniref:D-alanine aminotransferase n=1 Tax=hydrothermal vent metagenome TaxID=652676 RepID=A0A1W1EC66_9ZZZZ